LNSFKIGDILIPVPIVQGGMGVGISMSKLASAVANMGGIGVISTVGIGLIDKNNGSNYKQNNISALRQEIRKARKLTSGILGVNIMSVMTNFGDIVQTSIEEGIDIIFSGAGLPLDLPKYLKPDSKTKLVPIVSSARAAAIICNKWKLNYNYLPDGFVMEGPKAGGHLGFKSEDLLIESNNLENLIQEILAVTKSMKEEYNKDIPVIAAGGIFSGYDIFKIMNIGASGVQMGTRFVATEECDASPEFKNAFIRAREDDIKIIKSPVGMPGRTIFNQFLREAQEGLRRPAYCNYHCLKTCNPKTTLYCIAEALVAAYRGNFADGFAFTGANVEKVLGITTVKNLFNELLNEYMQAKMQHQIIFNATT
jgi:nitronate monooxygenase